MRTFEVNGKQYKAVELDFNAVCDLEDAGISIGELGKPKLSLVRAYFALCHGGSKEEAGNELNDAIAKNGIECLTPIIEALTKSAEESDFFRALQTNEETEAPA